MLTGSRNHIELKVVREICFGARFEAGNHHPLWPPRPAPRDCVSTEQVERATSVGVGRRLVGIPRVGFAKHLLEKKDEQNDTPFVGKRLFRDGPNLKGIVWLGFSDRMLLAEQKGGCHPASLCHL